MCVCWGGGGDRHMCVGGGDRHMCVLGGLDKYVHVCVCVCVCVCARLQMCVGGWGGISTCVCWGG